MTTAAGLLVRSMSPMAKRSAFIVTLLYSVFVFVSQLFSLSPLAILSSLDILPEMRLTAAPEYLLALAMLGALIVLGWHVAGRDMAFRSGGSLAIALGLTASWALVDETVTILNQGSYQRDAPSDAEFQSAAQRSGFARAASSGRHLVLIDVEAMGMPTDPALQRMLFRQLTTARVRTRFTIETGATVLNGSTVTSEIRELCGRWGGYDDLLRRPDPTCLPMRLRRQGYQTTAMHGFTPDFYDRATWYPNAGFQRMLFRTELVAQGAGKCPGLFPGACDRDVPSIIARQLQQARQPQFVHWVTLNSHFPVPQLAELHTDGCERLDPTLAKTAPMACRMFEIWDGIFANLAREITAADFPATDILLVGDHRPPFYDRKQRSMFSADRVPWILLRARR
ncbi:sulfatase-like hydrolase/transferase [Sphingomonas sp. PB4P5]|uniref:sulfatase-like hydrolase/transferase n=1 Tax=Parasphingomonas puruogangriensis TaxID=3096155 RepID=UPI002FCC6AF9